MTSALPGTLVSALADRCRVECEVGRGGMATVYLADDLKHGRKVAVFGAAVAEGHALDGVAALAEARACLSPA